MGIYVIRVPDIGEGIAEVELVTWNVQPGDSVTEDQHLADVMTDKATVEVPSPVHGKVISLGGAVGQVMAVGAELVRLEVEGEGNLKENSASEPASKAQAAPVLVAIASMGNPHAVQLVDNVDTAPVAQTGPLIENHARFPERVNAGYLQIVDRAHVRLRVFERGAGETLACGTGACAAVVAGIRIGLLDHRVDVQARGGQLTIEWAGGMQDHVFMTGPATTVFEGSIELPDSLSNPA